MKPSYAPDNTRSSIAVILLLAAGVTIVALLLGLSEKPQVESIGVAISPEVAAALLADAPAVDTDQATTDDDALDAAFSVPAPEPATDSASTGTAETTGTGGTGGTETAGAESAGATGAVATDPATGEVLLDEAGQPIPAEETAGGAPAVTAIPIPDPTATPEIVAAVEPTPEPATDDGLDALEAPARITAGTVNGSFFTRVFEDEGSTVARNEVSLTFNEDGTGAFSGTLDMTQPDDTRVTLSMSGPFEWSSLDSPQVVATLAGSYESDSLVETDDVSSPDAELTITSLGSGSGALCATDSTCFGFRFPAQTGF